MSKHHGGYAIDFRYPDGIYGSFRWSPGIAWLAKDNFAAAKRNGFIPSYPDDVGDQGPNPEPWEFVWVGADLIRWGIPQAPPQVTGPAAGLASDLARCPGGPTPAELPYWLREAGRDLVARSKHSAFFQISREMHERHGYPEVREFRLHHQGWP